MIPCNLPALAASAIRGGWDLTIEHVEYRPEIRAKFGHSHELVTLIWDSRTGHLLASAIGTTPTAYAQCARLIRSKESA